MMDAIERRQRGIKYVVLGHTNGHVVEMAVENATACETVAKLWAKNFKGLAQCYCVQDGVIGGRPFNSFDH